MHPAERIELVVAQWRAQRPDLDAGVMADVAHILHVARLVGQRLAAKAADHGLQVGEADVLFTLLRSGPPHRLSPTALADSTLVATGTMTNRLDKLEQHGLVRRTPNPDDRRGLAIELTVAGSKLADALVSEHVENERQMLSTLSEQEREQLRRILGKLLAELGSRP